jgi:hypothetical protein
MSAKFTQWDDLFNGDYENSEWLRSMVDVHTAQRFHELEEESNLN